MMLTGTENTIVAVSMKIAFTAWWMKDSTKDEV